MKTLKKNRGLWLLMLLGYLFPLTSPAQSIYFDDSDPQVMVLGNGTSYEISLFKLTGTISSLQDSRAGVELASGSTFDRLWSVEFFDGSSVRSTDYYPGEANDFSYIWDDGQKVLALYYTPDPLASIKVNVLVTLELNESNYFDIQLIVHNEGEGIIRSVKIPECMFFTLNSDDRVVFPITYPGTMYGSEFFESGETVEFEGDFMCFQIGDGNMAVYQLYNDTCIQTVTEGLYAISDELSEYNYCSSLRYYTWLEKGDIWTSQVSRFRIGQTPLETIQGFRLDNAIDNYPSVEDKLGSMFSTYTKSPFYPYTFPHFDPPGYFFWDVKDQLKYYPDPAIVFISHYEPTSCATCPPYMPDIYPPEPMFGTLEDFQQMITDLKSEGFLIMLATHPNFWHSESQTVANLPDSLSLEDIAVIDWNGNVADFDHFGELYIYISATSPFVQQKFDENYHYLFETYGTDMIYEDAVTSVPVYNFNKNEVSPLHHRQEWINYYKEHSSYHIIPEGAFVSMSESVAGIIGTSYEEFDRSDKGWNYTTDDGYWRPYPLVSRLYRDKVIPYPSYGVFTEDKDAVAWSTFFGCPFQVDLDEMSTRPYWLIEEHDGWIPVIHEFQGRVLARFIGKQLIDYLDLPGTATQADYGDIITVRNWDPDLPYLFDSHSIAPQGVYARNEDGDLEAGILTRYNGAELSPGDHYLIVETFTDSIEVRHPMGDATPLQVSRPGAWTAGDQIHVYAITEDSIKGILPTVTPDHIQFQLQEAVADTSRILKYLVLYGDTLRITSVNPARSETGYLECYPNPFSDRTRISYEVATPGKVQVRVLDISGRAVRVLFDGTRERGNYSMEWDGRNVHGIEVPTGIYLVSCSTAGGHAIKKIVRH